LLDPKYTGYTSKTKIDTLRTDISIGNVYDDEIIDIGDRIKVNGRIFRKNVYPDGFDFEDIKSVKGNNEPVVNFNNMVLDYTILDIKADRFKSKGPFNMSRIYGPPE